MRDSSCTAFDIHGYYRNIRHADADECFRRHLDAQTADACKAWLERQYPEERGYAPGSQMVQILGISLLDKFDHMVKERLRAKHYLRYMDDFVVIADDKAYLERCLEAMRAELDEVGLELHPKKTRIYPLKDGIPFLGFTFRLTDSGKVVRIINPQNVKHERKKLFRMAQLVKRGEITRQKGFECYASWRAHALKGNSWKLLQRMDAYAELLLEGRDWEMIKVICPTPKISDRVNAENARAAQVDAQSVIDYNVMVGNIEDPGADDEPENGGTDNES